MSVIGPRFRLLGLRNTRIQRMTPSSSLLHITSPCIFLNQSQRSTSSKIPFDPKKLDPNLTSASRNESKTTSQKNPLYENKSSSTSPSIQDKHLNLNKSNLDPSTTQDPLRSGSKILKSSEEFSTNHESVLPTESSSSTLASEILQVTSDLPPEGSSSHGRTGAKSKLDAKRPISSTDKRRQLIARMFGTLIITFTGIWAWNQGREWDNQLEKRTLGKGEDGTRLSRFQSRLLDLLDYFNKPAWNPLLPDPLPQPHGRPYTLLVDLDDLLVHSCWDREHGWRTAKRPGVDYFLSYLSQLYEIVIFTTQPAYTAAPICEKLDPYGYYAPYKLFKESCRTKGLIKTQLIKDLDYLGRDLKKVVYVDTEPKYFEFHPNNGFIIPKWNGDSKDTGLVDLIPLLEAIVFNAVDDVRSVSKVYQGRDPVRAYAESEARQKKELLLEWHQEREKKKSGLHFDLRGLFGLGSGNADEVPKLLVEKDRARAQQAYLQEQKYWKENEETFKKLMEEDRNRQMAEMKGSLLGFLTGQVGPARPPDQSSSPSTDPNSVK